MNKTKKKNSPLSRSKSLTRSLVRSLTKSYRPSVNKQLITLRTKENKTFDYCELNPLKIKIGKQCIPYSDTAAQKYLLKQLAGNKHLQMNKIITPKQYSSNCWYYLYTSCCFGDRRTNQ